MAQFRTEHGVSWNHQWDSYDNHIQATYITVNSQFCLNMMNQQTYMSWQCHFRQQAFQKACDAADRVSGPRWTQSAGLYCHAVWKQPTFQMNMFPPAGKKKAWRLLLVFLAWLTLPPWRWRWYLLPKCQALSELHTVTTQNTVLFSNMSNITLWPFLQITNKVWCMILLTRVSQNIDSTTWTYA
jgi:hypothetical protein